MHTNLKKNCHFPKSIESLDMYFHTESFTQVHKNESIKSFLLKNIQLFLHFDAV